MTLLFRRGLAIPLWVIALCAIVLTPPSRPLPYVMALLTTAVIVSMMMLTGRWLRTARPLIAGRPVPGRDARPARHVIGSVVTGCISLGTLQRPNMLSAEETSDALDLVRMDDDGGWRVALGAQQRSSPDVNDVQAVEQSRPASE